MMRHRLHFIAAFLFMVNCSPVNGQSDFLSQAITHASLSGDLANIVARVAHSGRIPMIVELAQPLPKIKIPGGSHTRRHLLELIAQQVPGYAWEVKGTVVHFYNRRLSQAKFNFLNLKFRQFSMSRNVSDLQLWFPTLEVALLNGRETSGAAISGFPNAELEKNRLQSEGLVNVTGREILFRAATESPTFFTVIVFPSAAPRTRKEAEQTTLNWFWWSFNEEFRPFYVQLSQGERHQEN